MLESKDVDLQLGGTRCVRRGIVLVENHVRQLKARSLLPERVDKITAKELKFKKIFYFILRF